MFLLPHGAWKDYIRSVILHWRQRSAGCSSREERSAGLSSERRYPLVTQADLSAPRVCSPAVALPHKKGPRHRRKICANSLWQYSYYTQSSPSKNKNMNYIFIYLRVLRSLSSGSTYDNGYRRRKWIRRGKFKSCTEPFTVHFALMSLGKIKINIFCE